ncbi:MAG: bifunctional serine/threonine-protein kinase/formylglycine-generating enzyme family protein, partial [Anaerolineales bacterium]|nr:bifunctional serine/threonine-protein kinase/formylglycine-generating enzyme family protein [Anaerolineales bacterium]
TILTNNKGPLPGEQSLTWIRQVCDALIYIHNQNPPIIHRDIKPANIRIAPQKNAVLVDFGLAKTFDIGAKTTMGARGLTPHFAAPEQYGTGGTDAQSDIYSLGVTLYCMLTYRVPPDSVEIMVGNANPPPPAKTISGNISDSVSDALQHAMQIRRTERYKSVSDFKTALFAEPKPFAQVKVVEPPAVPASNFANNKLILSNGMEFMRVPAGKFLMGSDNGLSEKHVLSEKPQHTVDIPYDYWIARFPITNEQYNIYIQAEGIDHPVSDWEKKKDHPVVNVTWLSATKYCKWLSTLLKTKLQSEMLVRLPTEAEWEKAARGTDGRKFPWGNTFDKNKCNSEEGERSSTTSVSLYSTQGDSPYGCADMTGNVGEWTHSLEKNYPYDAKDGREDEISSFSVKRVIRSGGFLMSGFFASCTYRQGDYSRGQSDWKGFRVAVVSAASQVDFLPKVSRTDYELPKPMQAITSSVSKNGTLDLPAYKGALVFSNGMEFMRVSAGKFIMGRNDGDSEESPQHVIDIPYDCWMARHPITNELYNAYVKDKGIEHPVTNWYQKKDHPVVDMTWHDAMDYCNWLTALLKVELPLGMIIRLPTEAEWEKAARGTDGRKYPWGNTFSKNKCNSEEGGKSVATPVGLYSPHGDSPYGCSDMVGNVWEWTHTRTQTLDKDYPYNVCDGREDEKNSGYRVLRGGAFLNLSDIAHCTFRFWMSPDELPGSCGFRVIVSLPSNLLR